MKPQPILTLSVLALTLTGFSLRASVVQLPDSDGNDLDDAWEFAYFGAIGNVATEDDDNDGRTNIQECNAGTDPTSPDSAFQFSAAEFAPPEREVTWETVLGKNYRFEFSSDVQDWSDKLRRTSGAALNFMGNGATLALDFSDLSEPVLTGGVTREVWLATGASGDIDSFKTNTLNWADASTPASATAADATDGTEVTVGLKAPANYENQYGQRLRGFITAPESGDYTFYIAGRHECELWLSSTAGSENPAALQQVLRLTNSNVEAEDFTYLADNAISPDEQKSAPVPLAAGERYYFEVIHRVNTGHDHLSIGWTKPSDTATDINVIPGESVSPALDLSDTNAASVVSGSPRFVRVITYGPNSPNSLDTDDDGIDDATENMLEGYNPFDAISVAGDGSGTEDLAMLSAAIQNSVENAPGDDVITVAAIDADGYENDGTSANEIRFRLSRSGGITGYTIFYTIGGGDDLPAEENGAESSDFDEEDNGGAPLSGSVVLGPGANVVDVVIVPIPDAIHEYPETVSLTIAEHVDYDPNPAASRAEGLIYDQEDITDNELLFVGFSVPQPGAPNPQQGSAIVSGKLNAKKDTLTLFTSITAGFSSPQTNSHVHKDQGTPGTDPVAFSLPPTGEIANLEWPLSSSGSFTPQGMIDSLFNQAGETTTTGESKVYVNWHTANNPQGELYAFLVPAVGSVEPPVPAAPPQIAFIDPDTQETELRREIVRFLNQATFGATPGLVDQMFLEIQGHPQQDRMAVFEQYLDEQLDESTTPQSRIFEMTMAADWHEWVARGYYDPTFFEESDWDYYLGRAYPGDLSLDLASENWPGLDTYDPDAVDYTKPLGYPQPTANWPVPFSVVNQSYRGGQFGLGRVDRNNHRRAMWTTMLAGRDQVRQRLAFAWSQILVISSQDSNTNNYYYGAARYWDMLAENADDDFNEMLAGVTYSPMMGNYLSHIRNQKEADLDNDGEADVFPDENYAREIMQLFSIGLFILHLDGSLALDSEEGLPQPTYNNNDITELSRVMTGLSVSYTSNESQFDDPNDNGGNANNENAVGNFNTGNGNRWYGSNFMYPMKMFGAFHDGGVKTIAGGVAPAGLTVDNTTLVNGSNNNNIDNHRGNADLNDVHAWLAGTGGDPATTAAGSPTYDGHPSTPAFISFRLIQRLFTSNPSREYVYRVAKVFNDTGGDLKEVSKAIFLDYEARTPGAISNVGGRKKPPIEGYMQMVRALEGSTKMPISDFGTSVNSGGTNTDYGLSEVQRNNFTLDAFFRYPNTDGSLSMSPQRAETVFNFYLPTYAPGGIISNASLVAPEFQILTETSAIQNLNYFYNFAWNGGNTPTGQGLQRIPNQNALGYPANADHNIPNRQRWIDFYPTSGPEWERDKALVDALDEILCAGALQETYALDPADRTPNGAPVVADANRNPYESIIDALTETYSTSSNGVRDKVRLAIYLIATSPAFQVQK